MSAVIKCDGCSKVSHGAERPKEWLKADVRDNHNTKFAVGDFCTSNCLARFLAVDPLDRLIKKAEGKTP
jgi:hypothetical protein